MNIEIKLLCYTNRIQSINPSINQNTFVICRERIRGIYRTWTAARRADRSSLNSFSCSVTRVTSISDSVTSASSDSFKNWVSRSRSRLTVDRRLDSLLSDDYKHQHMISAEVFLLNKIITSSRKLCDKNSNRSISQPINKSTEGLFI